MSSTISTARSQAASDAAEGIAALKKYGFGSGDVHYLDLEWYSRTTTCDRAVLEFIDVWTEKLHAPASSPASTPAVPRRSLCSTAAKASGRSMTYPDHLWMAWTNKVAEHRRRPVPARLAVEQPPADPPVPQQRQPIVRRTWRHDRQELPRRRQGLGGHQDPKPCDVAMSFDSYPRLQQRRHRVAGLGAAVPAQGAWTLGERHRHVRLEHARRRSTPSASRSAGAPPPATPPARPGRRCSRPVRRRACSSEGRSAKPSGAFSGPSPRRARASGSTASTTARPCRPSRPTAAPTASLRTRRPSRRSGRSSSAARSAEPSGPRDLLPQPPQGGDLVVVQGANL